MTSRLLNRLNEDIGTAPSALQADCLRAERAAYWVRLGEFERADAEIGALHLRHDGRREAVISARLNLAEGLRSHYTDLGQAARDKIQRAHVLSQIAQSTPLRALCAAWLAHLAYRRMDVPALASHLGEALRLATPQDDAAQARASLVMGQALDGAGRADLARPWYERAHRHTTSEGDETMLGSLLWQIAAANLATLRQHHCTGVADARLVKSARMGVDSVEHFDIGFGMRSLLALRPMLRAQLLTETGDCADALALFDTQLDRALEQGLATTAGVLLADRAWCRLQTGQRDAALADARSAEAQIGRGVRCGDRAPGHSRLAQVFAALGLDADAGQHQRLAADAWRGHADDQARLLDALTPLLSLQPIELRTASC